MAFELRWRGAWWVGEDQMGWREPSGQRERHSPGSEAGRNVDLSILKMGNRLMWTPRQSQIPGKRPT